MAEHIESAPPRTHSKSARLQQLEAALAAAQAHLATLMGKHAHNKLAQKIQRDIIAQYRRQIAELSEDSWLS